MLQKLLGFNPKTMTLRTESIAGITTFLYHELYPCREFLHPLLHRDGQGSRVHGYRACHRPLHLAAGIHGKAALGTGTQHGDQCLLRLHTGAGHGLSVASGYGCLVCGGTSLHPHHFL